MAVETDRAVARRGGLRGPQAFWSGAVMVALGAYAVWLTRDLSQGTLRSMGPAMLPRWLAIGVIGCGIVLLLLSLFQSDDGLSGTRVRGPLFVVAGVFLFGATIRGVGPLPGLGMIVAGPLAILVSGYATPEARFGELVILALALTGGCMLLFGDLLNLPIPLFPIWLGDLFPAGWSNDGRLRATAGLMLLAALAIWAATRVARPRGREVAEPVDVATHSGRI